MKLKKFFFIFSVLLLVFTTIVFATETEIMPRNIAEENDPIYDDDWFYCAEKIDLVEKTIEGNVFLIAKEVTLTDVNIMGSAYIITENLQLDGFDSTGSLYTISQKMVTKSANLANIYAISENMVLNEGTELFKNLYSIASSCEFNAKTIKNANIIGEEIVIGDKANVSGTLTVSSDEEPNMPKTASIGEYNFILGTTESDIQTVNTGMKVKNAIINSLNYIIGTIAIAFVVIKLFPSIIEKVNTYKSSDVVINAIIGFGLVVATPILAILLIVSGIFSKIGFAILWIYILAFVIASPLAVIIIGIMIAKKLDKKEFKYILGIIAIVALAVSVLKLVEAISGLVMIIMGIIGFGSILKLPLLKNKNY